MKFNFKNIFIGARNAFQSFYGDDKNQPSYVDAPYSLHNNVKTNKISDVFNSSKNIIFHNITKLPFHTERRPLSKSPAFFRTDGLHCKEHGIDAVIH